MRSGEPLADDPEGIAQLREALSAAGYGTAGIEEGIGPQDPVERKPVDVSAIHRRLAGRDALATLIELFLLGNEVAVVEATTALRPLALDRAETMGLLTRAGDSVQALIEITGFDDLLVVGDQPADHPAPPEHVIAATPPSGLLAAFTVQRPVESVLDVGTGSGVLALLAARHARQVIAVDVNPRALGFTSFSAALNDLDNVELRLGSLFEPVEGLAFDLIVSNPPFVISPETHYVFRDSGLPGDSFCETLVRRAPGFLTEGGLAQFVLEWVVRPDEEWSDPVSRWAEGSGCDAILVHLESQDPRRYAGGWNRQLRWDPPAFEAAVERWLEYYRELGADRIAFGALALRRRKGENWFSAHDGVEIDGDRVARLFEAQDFLAALEDERELLERPLVVEREPEFPLDGMKAVLLAGLDGRRTVRDILAEATSDFDEQAVLGTVRRLIELGFVRPA